MPRRSKLDPERELIEFLERLPVARIGVNNYTRMDRARDFIATFQSDESGRRVFAQIAAICDPPLGPNDPNLPNKAIWAAAQRHVLAQIMHCFVTPEGEPDDVPEQQ